MYLVYFDECKSDNVQESYYLCGFAVDERLACQIDQKLDGIAHGFFGTKVRNKTNELHAHTIMQKCAMIKLSDKIALFKKIIDLLKEEWIELIKVEIRRSSLKSKDIAFQDWALAYFVELVNELMNSKNDIASLMGDKDEQYAKKNIESFNDYRLNCTPGFSGRNIDKIVSPLRYEHSHNSRRLQLADMYCYLQRLLMKPKLPSKYRELKEYWDANPRVFPTKYKIWPKSTS